MLLVEYISRRVIGDNRSIVTSKVMRFDDGVRSFPSDVGHNRFKAREVRGIESTSDTGGWRYEAFHKEWDTEGIHPLA